MGLLLIISVHVIVLINSVIIRVIGMVGRGCWGRRGGLLCAQEGTVISSWPDGHRRTHHRQNLAVVRSYLDPVNRGFCE